MLYQIPYPQSRLLKDLKLRDGIGNLSRQVCSLHLLHTAFCMIGLIQMKGLIINPLRLNINIQIPWTDIYTFCTIP